jgi:DNA replication protein DnaC
VNNLNIEELDQEKTKDICKFFIKNNKNVFVFGRRGTGKTEICMQAIKQAGYNMNYINLSVLERADLNRLS